MNSFDGKKPAKPVKCKHCSALFERLRPMQRACSVACAVAVSRSDADKTLAKQRKVERRQDKAKLDAMRTRPQLLKAAQSAFNAFVRARDAGGDCISCGVALPFEATGGAFDCGHYRSVGSAPHMRFVEANAHGQCKHCNRYLSGNAVEYRKGLVARIGLQAVEGLECDQESRKYSKDALISLAEQYRQRAKDIKRKRAE